MKKLLLLTISVFATAMVQAKSADYEVTVQNLTKGQPVTPVVLAAHNPGYQLFKLGEPASAGLALQAKDGVTDTLVAELNSNYRVGAVLAGSAPILPGQKSTYSINADHRSRLSVSSMLGRTNDAIVAGRNLRLPRRAGVAITYYLSVYDAGAEANLETCAYIPAPPCNNPGLSPSQAAEGFVHAHPGVFGIGDLNALRDTFGRVAAKITITKK